MKPGLLIVQKRTPLLLDALARDYTVHDYGRAADKDAFVAEVARDVRAMLTNGRGGAGADLIAARPGSRSSAVSGWDTKWSIWTPAGRAASSWPTRPAPTMSGWRKWPCC